MKRTALSSAIIWLSVFLFSAMANCADTDEGGFRGLRWGTPLAEIMKTHTLTLKESGRKDRLVFYSMVGDNLKYGGITAASIQYIFWKNRLAGATVVTKNDFDLQVLKVAMSKKLGVSITGIGPSGEEVTGWDDDVTLASLWYDEHAGKGRLFLFSKVIDEEKKGLESEGIEDTDRRGE